LEASALHASPRIARISLSGPLLRLRSDEQLVGLFRAGSDDAFAVIHDRYRPRMFAYARQMLSGSRQDAEDAVQDVFVRAYGALRADERPIVLRAWLYRVAHNRCIDVMRRPAPAAVDVFDVQRGPGQDPLAAAERREDLRQLVQDVRALPAQQRSALLMRELEGLSYGELAAALGTTVPAVKSLLVRARVGLAATAEARDADCADIRADLALAHGRGVRATGRAWRHVRECDGCREFRQELRSIERRFAALAPVAITGPLALLAKLTGGASGGGSATAGSGAAAGSTTAAGSAAAGSTAAGSAVAAGSTAAAAGSTAAATGSTVAAGTTAAGGAAAAGSGAMAAGTAAAAGSGALVPVLGGASVLTAGKFAAVVASVVVTGAAGVAVEQRLESAPPPAPAAIETQFTPAPAAELPLTLRAPDTAASAEPSPAAGAADPSVATSGGTVAASGDEVALPVEPTGGVAAPSEPTVAGGAGEGPPAPPDATGPDPAAPEPPAPESDPVAAPPAATPGEAAPGAAPPEQPAPAGRR
jgi:RNA polymerase sigma factor (sigma-70 family)